MIRTHKHFKTAKPTAQQISFSLVGPLPSFPQFKMFYSPSPPSILGTLVFHSYSPTSHSLTLSLFFLPESLKHARPTARPISSNSAAAHLSSPPCKPSSLPSPPLISASLFSSLTSRLRTLNLFLLQQGWKTDKMGRRSGLMARVER